MMWTIKPAGVTDVRRLLMYLLLVPCLVFTGCGDPTVDTSTDEAMKESIAEVKASLPESKRAEFEEALKTLAFADVDDLGDLAALGKTGAFERRLKEFLDGKTGEEIIAEAKRVAAEKQQRQARKEAEAAAARKEREEARLERERDQALTEIQELRTKLVAANPRLLSKFVVGRSRFSKSDGGFIPEKQITLTVRNDTGSAVSRAYFRAILLTPGRELPWVDAEFNYEIPGGLEPGESATWNLRPNMFGGWSNAPDDRDDMLFIARAVDLEGADGKSLTGERFDADDEKRLRELLDSIDYEGEAELRAALDRRAKAVADWQRQATKDAAKSERDELARMRDEATAAKASLAKFAVTKSRFYFSKDRFSSDPVIDVTVHNGTGKPVTRFYARGVLASPDRKTPWVEDEFNYSVRGGLAPGETQNFKLAPNMFGEWGRAPKDRDDMVLTVTITRLDGPDGVRLFEAEFTEDHARRLAALEKMIAEQGWK